MNWDFLGPYLFWVELVSVALILAFACLPNAHGKREKKVNLELPHECVKKVTLVDCDLNVNPPKCRTATVIYSPPSCAIVHLE